MTVEVFIHTLEHKMSIASQVSIPEIFGVNHEKLSFSQKTQILDHMMEKLFVIQSDGQYHLKVDNDAVPLGHLRHQRRVASRKPHAKPERTGSDRDLIVKKQEERDNEEELDTKLQEILASRQSLLAPEKCHIVKTYA